MSVSQNEGRINSCVMVQVIPVIHGCRHSHIVDRNFTRELTYKPDVDDLNSVSFFVRSSVCFTHFRLQIGPGYRRI